ncbi:DUF308 domain-containing protein [Metabacillus herbersteinensis]|uniref:DUF308 domain-containing protein n=1 Tax=Metabacillus herbersteinensis TaxID=283816 RepID=A0ABV6G9F2_9BACI
MPDEKDYDYHGSVNRYDNRDNPEYKGIPEIEKDNLYHEETAAELAAPIPLGRDREYKSVEDRGDGRVNEGKGTGYLGIALSIISLFMLPVILGAAGIIVGFIARRRGAKTLGAWAIGIGAASLVLGIFILPFF